MADAKRAARAAARVAKRKAAEEAWRARADAHFGYLQTRYGFRITQVDAASFWCTRLVYESAATAVYVDRSVEFNRVEVSLIRLVNGAIPDYPIFVTPDLVLHQFLLDNLLRVRAPHLLPELDAAAGLGDEQIATSLALLARALEAYASDVLQGDFTIFATLEQQVKQRVREHPQVLSIWVAEDTPPEEAAQLAEKVRRDAPTQPVVVRTYRRRKATGRKKPADGVNQPS